MADYQRFVLFDARLTWRRENGCWDCLGTLSESEAIDLARLGDYPLRRSVAVSHARFARDVAAERFGLKGGSRAVWGQTSCGVPIWARL